MSKNNYSDSKFSNFISGKGFYLAMAVCLAGAGAASWVAMGNQTAPTPVEESSQVETGRNQTLDLPLLEDVARPDTTIPKESLEQSKQEPKSQSSQLAPSKQETNLEQSGQQVLSVQQPFILPIDAEIFADYSQGELVKDETLGDWRTHNGIDIKAEEGTEVKAVGTGKVNKVYTDPLWGAVVEIEHNAELVSIYCGLGNNVKVREGDTIQGGDVIGVVSYIPAESKLPSHLHFEMKKEGNYVDPLKAMGKK